MALVDDRTHVCRLTLSSKGDVQARLERQREHWLTQIELALSLANRRVADLNAEVVKALHAPDLQARFEKDAIDTKSLHAADFTTFFRAEMERWTPLAREVAAEVKAAGDAPR